MRVSDRFALDDVRRRSNMLYSLRRSDLARAVSCKSQSLAGAYFYDDRFDLLVLVQEPIAMDWKQFVSSIITSLAWPTVVVVLLVILRKELRGVARRIQELSLPGGVKATFEKDLERGREITEHAPALAKRPEEAEEHQKTDMQKLAIESPDGAVVLAYIEIERKIRAISNQLGKPDWADQRKTVNELVRREVLDPAFEQLFVSLRNARNAAAHGRAKDGVSTSEAIEYLRQATFLVMQLDAASDQLTEANKSTIKSGVS